MAPPRADLVELRVLDGPNLYFPRPAVKLTIAVEGWLEVPEERLVAALERVGATGRPGRPGSDQRRRTVARLAARLTWRLATASKVRLAVRSRPGPEPDQVVVAFPWRRRGSAEALGREVAPLLDEVGGRRSVDRLLAEAAARVAEVEPGDEPEVSDPSVPVVSVTGTNGKTTTVRLLAHIVRSAGKRVAYSSTDGVYRGDGELIEEGDYSGFGGAARALAERPDVAVLETARGGILLRGIGVLHNDVAVVTNVSEDHLGLQGIQTIDQLSEVKASVTRITRPDGWDVLNADDPRVLSMRRLATGRPWLCSLDPWHPAIRDTLADGGRATVPLDGWLTVLDGSSSRPSDRADRRPRHDLRRLAPQRDERDAGGVRRARDRAARPRGREGSEDVRHRSRTQPGTREPVRARRARDRARLRAQRGRDARASPRCATGCGRPGREIWLVICTAGDRTDRILHDFAYAAARGADHVAAAELLRYLRGRDRLDVIERLIAGARDGGAIEVDAYADELAGLRGVFGRSKRGDVIGVTALGMRTEDFAWLEAAGAKRLTPADVKRLVRRATAAPGTAKPSRALNRADAST